MTKLLDLTEEEKNEIENRFNIKLLSDTEDKDNIEYKCNLCGKTYVKSLYEFRRKNRTPIACRSCFTHEYFHNEFLKKYGEITVEIDKNQYVENRETPIKIKCLKCGNEYETNYDKLVRGSAGHIPCKYCQALAKKKEFKQEKVIKQTKVITETPKIIRVQPIRVQPIINHSVPVVNDESILEFLTSEGIEYIEHEKEILKEVNMDIGIYLSAFRVGIEYCRLNIPANRSNMNEHINKERECAIRGIRLIHIFEDEWIKKQAIVKSKIKHILKLDSNEHIYARKCEIREIDKDLARDFLMINHIQGSCGAKYKFGLFYNNELVAVMTFGNYRKNMGRAVADNEYELIRYATSKNVVGGFGKLFNYFVKEYKPVKIITYADLRWTSHPELGESVYNKAGFKLNHISQPNYYYCKDLKRNGRFSFRKDELAKKFPDLYSPEKTEFEIMDATDYTRVYDCGNISYEYVNPEFQK